MRRPMLAAMLALACATPAEAATRWQAADVVSAPGGYNPVARMDARGRALVVWQQARPDGLGELRYAWRAPRREFDRPRVLGAAGTPPSYPEHSIALAAGGIATAAHVSRDGRIAVARAAAGEAFGAPMIVGGAVGPVTAPVVATDDEGRAVVVWSEQRGQDDSRVLALAVGRDDGVGAPRDLGPGQAPTVAMNPAGAAVVAWIDFGGRAHAAVRPAGGDFGPPTAPAVRSPGWPRSAIDAHGRAVVATSRFLATGAGGTTFSVADEAGAFGPQRELDAGGIVEQLLAEPRGAVDFASNRPDGDGRGGRFAFASHRPGGELVGPADISGPEACAPHLAVARGGDLLATWTATCTSASYGTASRAAVRIRRAGDDGFEASTPVGLPGAALARGAVTDGDEAVVVYTHGPTRTVHAVVREDRGDDALPKLPEVDVRLPGAVTLPGLDDVDVKVACRRRCGIRTVGRLHAGHHVLRGSSRGRRLRARRRARLDVAFSAAARPTARAAIERGERPFVTVSLAVRGASPRTHTLTRRVAVVGRR